MKNLFRKTWVLLLVPAVLFTFSSCEKVEEEIPTKELMEGVWLLQEAISSEGDTVTNKVRFPICAFHLSSDRTIISTSAPLTMYIVYGNNKYTEIASKIDQVFNYASLDFNGGEFFIAGGVQPRFTLEMKLQGLPGQKALTDLLSLIGIHSQYLDPIVYHKFMDVAVSFRENNDVMVWEIDELTKAAYNTKDSNGNYVLWQGWPINNFQRIRVTFNRQIKDLKSLVQDAL